MKDYPVIKFTLLFIAGILSSRLILFPVSLFFVFLTLLIFMIFLLRDKAPQLYSPAISLILFFIILLFGNIVSQLNSVSNNLLPEEIQKEKSVVVFGKVKKIDLLKDYEISFLLSADSVRFSEKTFYGDFLFQARIRDEKRILDSLYKIILPGNYVSLNCIYSKGRERRNPGEFDFNIYLRNQGISGILTCYSAKDLEIMDKANNTFETQMFFARRYLDEKLSSFHEKSTAGLLKGLLFGERAEISPETKTDFINTGVVHVLAVSGLHVVYIAIIFMILFGRFDFLTRSILTIIGLLIFTLITNSPSSVVRATIMGIVIIIGFLSNRSTNIFNSLAISALIILLFSPSEIYSPGFQLSFAAVIGIASINPFLLKAVPLTIRNNKPLNVIVQLITVSLSAQIGTLPFTLAYFGKLSLVSIFTNLMVVPLTGFILAISIATLLISSFSHWTAYQFATANELLTEFLFWFTHMASNLPYSFLWIRQYSFFDGTLFYLLLFSAFYFIKKIFTPVKKVIFIIVIISLMVFLPKLDDVELLPDDVLSLLMIDVGQGDSFLIKFPDGQTALIDAGEANYYFDNGEKVILPLLNYLNIEKINYGFVSHIDLDHYGGFVSLIQQNKIDTILKPRPDSSAKDIRFEEFLLNNNKPVKYYEKKSLRIGGAELSILNNLDSLQSASFSSNDKSGMIIIQYGKTKFLFTGDAEEQAEMHYLNSFGSFLDVDVLKVSHHGSETGTTKDFLAATSPKISLISCGIENKFGHPSERVLERLEQAGSKIFRTDKLGAVLIRCDGESVQIIDWRK